MIPQALVDLEVADTGADELVVTDGMASRKTLMIERSDAFLVLPGGLGTLDELFEVWTTATLGLHAKPIVLLDADGFYAGLLDWLRGLADQQFVRPGGDCSMLWLVPPTWTSGASLDLLDSPPPRGCRTGPLGSSGRDRDRFPPGRGVARVGACGGCGRGPRRSGGRRPVDAAHPGCAGTIRSRRRSWRTPTGRCWWSAGRAPARRRRWSRRSPPGSPRGSTRSASWC